MRMEMTLEQIEKMHAWFAKHPDNHVGIPNGDESDLYFRKDPSGQLTTYLRFYPLTDGVLKPLEGDRQIFVIPIGVVPASEPTGEQSSRDNK